MILYSNLLLLLAAAIWGFAFVAQRKGMEHIDPLSFNAIRFALGAIFVRIVYIRSFRKRYPFRWELGVVLFVAATLQQIGMVYTSSGNAGFITGLYVVFVPLIGLIRGQKITLRIGCAIALSIAGMYLINSFEDSSVTIGNLFILFSAVFWAIHVQLIDRYNNEIPAAELAISQYAVCAALSFIMGFAYLAIKDTRYLVSIEYAKDISNVILPILYGGIASVGIAYTLQVQAQRHTKPSSAAVILSSEGAFAMLGGWWLLQEAVNYKIIIGSITLLTAMIVVSIPQKSG